MDEKFALLLLRYRARQQSIRDIGELIADLKDLLEAGDIPEATYEKFMNHAKRLIEDMGPDEDTGGN